MTIQLKKLLIGVSVILLVSNCDSDPKVISAQSNEENNEGNTGIFSDVAENHAHNHNNPADNPHVHSVVVEEVLQASKYVYLYVRGPGKKFWIATNKREVKPGETYLFQEALLKTQFESKEYNRIFDTIFLVANIIKEGGEDEPSSVAEIQASSVSGKKSNEHSIKIAELVGNPKKYDGKSIQITGTCVKVNRNIMGRNWIHLQDGSKDDYDLVITSEVSVPKGHTITMTGKVTLNKDFGANYSYDIILEEGELVR